MASNNTTFYLEQTDFSFRVARVTASAQGRVIDELREVVSGSPEEVKKLMMDIAQMGAGGLVRAFCSIYPKSRVLRNCNLKDPSQAGETSTIEEVVTNQFHINPSEYALQTLYADDGLEFQPGRVPREMLICGASRAELKKAQESLLEAGVYPLGMELGSVATIGLLLESMRHQGIEEPVLVLEIGEDTSHVLILNRNRVESARPLPLGLNTMVAGVRQELGLKDEGAAKKLFYSDSFDFREMGPRLIDRILREVQSMIGFYEVQTGQSISRMRGSLLPTKLNWLSGTFAASLGMSRLDLDIPGLLAKSNITVGQIDSHIHLETALGLFGLMISMEASK